MAQIAELLITPDVYLEEEKSNTIRHEFVNGYVYAMAGESKQHNEITGNLYILLRQHLQDSPCRVFMENVKTAICFNNEQRFFYPDIQVSCEPDDSDVYYEDKPILIIEILSPSTERYDRTEKFSAYRKIPTLQEYVLVAQDIQRVEVYRRSNNWDLEVYGMYLVDASKSQQTNTQIYFESIDCYLNIEQIYQM